MSWCEAQRQCHEVGYDDGIDLKEGRDAMPDSGPEHVHRASRVVLHPERAVGQDPNATACRGRHRELDVDALSYVIIVMGADVFAFMT